MPKDEEEEETKAPKRGVGTIAIEAIKAKMTNEEVLEVVKKEFPDKNTSLASVNWYRNKLRSDGKKCDDGSKIPMVRELKKAAKTDPLDN